MSADPRPNREWTAEHIVGPEQARELLRAQFPFLGSADITPVAEGWDNTVYLVGGGWVFRSPRRTVSVPTVEKEIDVLPSWAPRLPLPVPVPELVGTPTESYPWPFWGARLIDGRELPDHQLPSESRIDLAYDVGAFLAVLHAPDQKAAVGAHLPLDPMHRGTPRVRVPMARKRLARLQQSGFWQGDPAVERLLAQAEGLGASPAEPVLAHGDLHVRHVLVARTPGPLVSSTGAMSASPTVPSMWRWRTPRSPGGHVPGSSQRTGRSLVTVRCVPEFSPCTSAPPLRSTPPTPVMSCCFGKRCRD